MIDYERYTWFLSDVHPVLNKTSLTIVVYRTAETYECGRMEGFNRLKTVSPQKFRRNTSVG